MEEKKTDLEMRLTSWHNGEYEFKYQSLNISALKRAVELAKKLGYTDELALLEADLTKKEELHKTAKDMKTMTNDERYEIFRKKILDIMGDSDSDTEGEYILYPQYHHDWMCLKASFSASNVNMSDENKNDVLENVYFNHDHISDSDSDSGYEEVFTIHYDNGTITINFHYTHPEYKDLSLQIQQTLYKIYLTEF